jgi:ribosomal protein L39E
MRIVTGNLWDYLSPDEYICITTNGFLKNNGEAVMGRGCALEATRRFPDIAKKLGQHIKKNGNVPAYISLKSGYTVISFPVKHNWYEKGDLDLIKKSALWLQSQAVSQPDMVFILPRPGCGNGQLDWEEVRKVIKFLPDNVLVISKR